MSLGRSNRKELHILETGLVQPLDTIKAVIKEEFADIETLGGEFTPAYLRCPWVPEIARAVLPEDAVLFVLLRDPVDRFASAMAHEIARMSWTDPNAVPRGHVANWARFRGVDATWAGMYATHLATWARVFPHDRFVVIQYEAMAADPIGALAQAHRALGLETPPLRDPHRPSATTTQPGRRWRWEHVPWLKEELVELYTPEVVRVAERWGIDLARWPHFSHLL